MFSFQIIDTKNCSIVYFIHKPVSDIICDNGVSFFLKDAVKNIFERLDHTIINFGDWPENKTYSGGKNVYYR